MMPEVARSGRVRSPHTPAEAQRCTNLGPCSSKLTRQVGRHPFYLVHRIYPVHRNSIWKSEGICFTMPELQPSSTMLFDRHLRQHEVGQVLGHLQLADRSSLMYANDLEGCPNTGLLSAVERFHAKGGCARPSTPSARVLPFSLPTSDRGRGSRRSPRESCRP